MLTSLIILQVIPSLISYIIIVLIFLIVLPGPFFPKHNLRRWAKLTSIFLVISLLLEQQTWFRVCVLTVVPITFCFHHCFDLMSSIDRLHLHETSRQNLSWSSSTFWVPPGYQLNSWWEIPSLPLDDLCYHRQHSCFPFNTNLFMFCVVPWDPCYPTYVMFYLGVLLSFMSRMSWEIHHP